MPTSGPPPRRRSTAAVRPPFRGDRRRWSPRAEALEARQLLATFIVTSSADDGEGTLREAITLANDTPGADVINFDLATATGPIPPIALLSPLPDITEALVIDGTTQAGYAGTPLIQLDGVEAFGQTGPVDGLVVLAGPSTIRGLAIYSFSGSGIRIGGPGSVTVEANYLGSNSTNDPGLGNGGYGVLVVDSPANRIGSTNAARRNLISDNLAAGVGIQGTDATRNVVLGNLIGVDAAGTNGRGNQNGVEISNAPANTIGGNTATSRNILSGNLQNGLLIQGATATGNVVRANYIGLDRAGALPVGNGLAGIQIDGSPGNSIGATLVGGRNVISGNTLDGLSIVNAGATGNRVLGNYIGTNPSGVAALGNGGDGVRILGASANTIGGTTNASRNLISGNGGNGLTLSGGGATGNVIRGNIVGLSDGSIFSSEESFVRLPNATDGLLIEANAAGNSIGGAVLGAGNLFSANARNGIRLDTVSGNLIQGNAVGTTLFIGGTIGQAVNLGNGSEGINLFLASGNTIGGEADTGTLVGPGNVLANNGVAGLAIRGSIATGNLVLGNRIGSDATGRIARPNSGDGLVVSDAPGNTIGGFVSETNPLGGNLIIANAGNGIIVSGPNASGNRLIGNRIGLDANGQAQGNSGDGIRVIGSSNTVGGTAAGAGNVLSANRLRGLVFSNLTTGGTTLLAAGNVAAGNFIGVNLGGSAVDVGNFQDGLMIEGAVRTTIGGTTAGARNVISGNLRNGLLLTGDTASNLIAGNYIGLDAGGTAGQSSNAQAGIVLQQVRDNTIGGTAAGAGNVISGNTTAGLILSAADANLIQGNHIGVDPAGQAALPNAQDGLIVDAGSDNTIGGTTDAARNLISGNLGNGLVLSGDVELGGSRNVVQGNRIGTNAAGSTAIANRSSGVVIVGSASNTIGGLVDGAGNLVSGNGLFGLSLAGDVAVGNVLLGNRFGTDAGGTRAIANRQAGLAIDAPDATIGGAAAGAGNLISGNGVAGLTITAAAPRTLVQGNIFGLDRTGSALIPNANEGILVASGGNTIGGAAAGAGNLISGNRTYGISLSTDADGNRILGNTIGLNRAGNRALGNALSGIFVNGSSGNLIGGTTAAAANLISGNALYGIQINGSGATGNLVVGNIVGLARGGAAALGNALSGIYLNGAPQNTIGGTGTGAGNIVSGNGGAGLEVLGGTAGGNLVQGNLFGLSASGSAALGNATHGVLVNGAPGNTIGAAAGTPGGNVISGNAGNGVLFQDAGATGNLLFGNAIGTDVDGNRAIPNAQNGVIFSGAPKNQVVGNLISGNALNGVGLNATSPGNRVSANTIGTNRGGTRAIANDQGILVDAALDTMIDANLISGNASTGIVLQGSVALRALVQANIIGTDRSAQAPLSNGVGILIAGSAGNTIGGAAAGLGNLISGNAGLGIQLNGAGASRNVIAGNKIGTNGPGNAAVPNGSGIFLNSSGGNTIGGLTPLAANVISGNTSTGIYIFGADARANRIVGNRIGTVADGTRAILIPGAPVNSLAARQDVGILINAAPGNIVGGLETGAGNLISGNYAGVNIAALASSGNLVLGNRIGTNAAGTSAVGNILGVYINAAPSNTIGGGSGLSRNIISGNTSVGVEILGTLATNNVVAGNYIGTNARGDAAIANGNGVFLQDSATGNTIGGTTSALGNVISGNASVGIYFFNASINNSVISNKIGTDALGIPSTRLANKQYGILLFNAANNTISSGSGGINQNLGAIANLREFTGRTTTTAAAAVAQASKTRKGKTVKPRAVVVKPQVPNGPRRLARVAQARRP